jgi:alpha-glucosidase (family GH31 glycosyl hydrolase)
MDSTRAGGTTKAMRKCAKVDAIPIPHDVLWLDLDHTKDKKYFTIDPITFPHALEFQDHFDRMKRKMVVLIDRSRSADSQSKQRNIHQGVLAEQKCLIRIF